MPLSGELEQLAHAFDEFFDVEGFFDEVVGAGAEEFVDFFLVDDARDDDDFHVFELGVVADGLADDVAVDVGEHVVEDHEVGGEFLGEHAGVVAGGGGFDVEAAVAVEDVDEEFDDFGVVVDDEDFAAAGVEVIQGDAIVFHEFDHGVARDAAELGAGDAETAEASGVEAADDGLLGDFADFCGFAGGVDFFDDGGAIGWGSSGGGWGNGGGFRVIGGVFGAHGDSIRRCDASWWVDSSQLTLLSESTQISQVYIGQGCWKVYIIRKGEV